MQAAVIESHGGPEAVSVKDVPVPPLAPGTVSVRIVAAALNHLDLRVARGGRAKVSFPHVLGSDGSGVVLGVGAGVEDIREGTEVVIYSGLTCGRCEFCLARQDSQCRSFGIIGMSSWGTFAQSAVVPAANVAPKPASLTHQQAAGIGVAHLTAWRMLFSRARVLPGETVLIHGIGGGVALAALQLAQLAGARTIVTSSSPDKLRRAEQLGAWRGFNYKLIESLPAAVLEATGGRGVDVVIDSVGGPTLDLGIQMVRRGGRIVLCGVTGSAEAQINAQSLYWNQASILGSTLGSRHEHRQLLTVVEHKSLSPAIDSVYPLSRVPEALQRLARGEQFGKIIVEMPS